MTKSNYTINRQQQEDLMKAYCRVSGSSYFQQEAFIRTTKEPAPRYYVSPKQAYQVLSKMMHGDFSGVDRMHDTRRRMYYSLYERTLQLAEQRAFLGKSLWAIVPYAVLSPAPEFFIGCESVRRIRRWIKKRIIDDTGRVCKPIEYRKRAYQKLQQKRNKNKYEKD